MPRSARSVGGATRWLALFGPMLFALCGPVHAEDGNPPAVVSKSTLTKPTPGSAEELDQKLMNLAKNESEIMKNLGYISDEIGPRLTGSAALKRANEWTMAKMKEYGLVNTHLEGWTIPTGWERGTASARIVEPNNGRSLLIAAAGWSPGTKGKVVGDVVILDARNTADLEKYKGKLKNAIVLRGRPSAAVRTDLSRPAVPDIWGGAPGGRRPGAAAAAGDAKKAADAAPPKDAKKGEAAKAPEGGPRRGGFGFDPTFRRELNEFLRKEGVACMVNDSGKPQGLLVVTGSWQGGDRVSAPEPLPSCYMAHEHYALLYRLASRPAPAKTQVEIEMTNKFIPGPYTVYNTVGEITGSEKPNEYVVLGAHLDSWDLGSGTTDNGTGSSIVLECARIIAKCGVKPKRTIRFVLFSGEEQGLYGSKAYVQQHKDELPRISMALVHDTGTGKVTGIGLQGREAIKPILEKELASLQPVGPLELSMRGMGGSDHASFDGAGVPGFAVMQDMSEYFLTHHTQSDTLDKVHEENLIQGAQVLAVTGMRVANLPELLPRTKPEGGQRRRGQGRPGADGEPVKQAPAKKEGIGG